MELSRGFDKIMTTVFGYSDYQGYGDIGATSLAKAKYQRALEKANPDHDCTPLENKIDSFIGTSFHERAEKAIRESGLEVELEKVISGEIVGYKVGGTADLLIKLKNGKYRVGDWKTMKVFTAKKTIAGETDKFVKQLSVYNYLLKKLGYDMDTSGYIYGVVTGWTARDKQIPRAFRLKLDLLTDQEVEDYVTEAMKPLEGKCDCQKWLCGYCRVRDICPEFTQRNFGNEV